MTVRTGRRRRSQSLSPPLIADLAGIGTGRHARVVQRQSRQIILLTTFGRLAAILALILIAAVGATAGAQTPATPPPPIPQDQFDALVKTITQSVLEKLKAEP